MNKIYRLIWSKSKERWQAVSEKVAAGWSGLSLTAGTLVLAALLAAGGTGHALDPATLPTGGQIVAGQGSIAQSGSAMTVTQQTERMIAHWNSFNIGASAAVTFQQPGASSVALNRILDQNPSQIFGSLRANGQVFLLNPAGVYFGPTARVDVGGLVASSLNLSNEDFLKGNYRFGGSSLPPGGVEAAGGAIANDGTIRTAQGGYVAFLSPSVSNRGTIAAPGGTVALAAGSQVSLDFTGDRLVSFTVDQGAIDAQIENQGLIQAEGGLVMLTAKAADALTQAVVNTTGVIEARGITTQGGRILLDAEGGQTTVGGALDASSAAGRGGRIVATGDRVLVEDGAQLTASGATGGGEVLVGGSWQNSDPTVRQATGTVVEAGAVLEANATVKGDGGTVVAWSDVTNPASVTRAYGTFAAKGGPEGGDGGRIETSGHWLDAAGARGGAAAPSGRAGTWLYDPYNVTITGASANGAWGSSSGTDTWTPSGSGSTILNTDINGKLEGGTNVTVTTHGAGAEIGDITVGAAITKASGDTDVTLTLQAANSIVVDQAIANTGGSGKLHVLLDADNNNGARDGGGVIMLRNDISTGGGSLTFGTGATTSINGVNTLVGGDVYVAGAGARTLSTGGGSLDVKGEMIVANTNGLTINSGNGNVRFHGLLNSGNQYAFVDKTGSAGLGTWDEARTEARNGTAGGAAVNDSYLVTITSRLENAIAVAAAGYKGSWIGAYRPNVGSLNWQWADGPEGGTHFFTQTAGGGGSATSGHYANFGAGEPNGSTMAGGETRGQFFGTGGQWNDLVSNTAYKAVQGGVYDVLGFVRETNLAASPVTVNAGTGTVTFSGAVGTSKALASLDVTAATTAINGGAVTTNSAGAAGGQSYSGNITLGSAATTLTMLDTPTAFTVASGKSITNATGADATLTLKNTAPIILDANSAISSSAGRLHTVLWADSDANGGYIWTKDGSSIATNGGHLWMGGGSGSTTWNGLTVGNGYALGDANNANGILVNGSTFATSGGHISLHGKSRAGAAVGGDANVNADGVRFRSQNAAVSVDSGAGTIVIDGVSQGTTQVGVGVEFLKGAFALGVTSAATAGDAIRITGVGSSAAGLDNSNGIFVHSGTTITATGGGDIVLEGTGGTAGTTEANYINAATLNANAGNLTVTGDTLSLAGTLSGTGTLTIQPKSAGTTIGIAGGTGTLSLPASYFSTNFSNGFSRITVGSATAGNITVGNTALAYNDPLTLKTAGNITTEGGAAVTGGAGQTAHLTLWSDADANNDGYISLYDGTAIDTNGGDITMAGGADSNSDGRPDGFATATATYSGISIGRLGTAVPAGATSIRSDGGNIFLKGKSTAGAGNGMGVHFSYYGTLDAGAGNLTMIGESSSYAGIELSAWLNSVPANSYLDVSARTVNISGTSSNTGYHGLASSQLNTKYTRITAGAGGITLYGHNTANTAKGVEISLNATTTDGGNITVESPNHVALYGGANAHSFNAGTGNTTLRTNTLSIGANHTLTGSGTLTVVPYNAGTTIGIAGGAGTLQLTSGYFSTNFSDGFSGITVGRTDGTGKITAGAFAVNDALTLRTGSGGIELTGLLNAGSNTVTLTSTGSVTDSGSGAVTAGSLALLGAGGSVTLDGTGHDVGTLAADTGSVTYVDSNALTVGTVNPSGITASGPVSIATLTGDLTVAQNITTGDASSAAIVLNAGKSAAAGTATGGNIVLSGSPVFTTGAGGRTTLYTGGVSGSTGVTALIGSGSGRFRYNSDESATNYTTALGTGRYAIYRERPTVTTTASDASKTYDGLAYSGGNGVTHTGFVNGDTAANLGGTLAYGGTSQGVLNAGTYAITPGGYSNGLGYALAYADGTLTVNKAALTVTASDASKTYDGLAYSGGNGVAYTGFVNGETRTVLGGTLAYGGTSQGAVNTGRYTIVPSGLTSGNYTLSYASGTLEIAGNRQSENVDAGVTSTQKGVNGTQQTSGLTPGAANTPALGPGAGSTTLGGLATTSLVAAPPAGTGSAVLSCNAFTTPVSIRTSETAVMLALGGGASQGPAGEVCALTLFARHGSEPPAPQGRFVLSESGRGLSLTRTAAVVPTADPGTGGGPAPSAPFTLNLENGMTLSLTVAVTAEGVLVVTAPDSAGALDVRQAILMGTQVAREALQLDPRALKSAVFQTI